MSTPMVLVAERTAPVKPQGTDLASLALLVANIQAIGNRGEWNAKKLVDVKHAVTTAADNDIGGASFAWANAPSLAALTFTEVSVGDVILLHCSMNVNSGEFTSDATNPQIEGRFFANDATDVTVAAGSYPMVHWGSTVPSGATEDVRLLTFLDTYSPAAPAASLPVRLQVRVPVSQTVFNTRTKIVGVHFRLGAA